MRKRRKSTAALGALAGLAVLGSVSPATAQESGAQVWGRACGRCHRAQPPNKYDADAWHAIMGHMALNARLTSEEEAAVREFLMGAARRLTQEPSLEPVEVPLLASAEIGFLPAADSAGIYEKQCSACHGSEGKGDGPAAAALTPHPTDLTDTERIGALRDEELLEVLKNGKGAMPGFARLLTEEELKAVLGYVRRLSEEKDED
ncbi:MAG: c-type cytochrome [Gemmatimonadota bacterium]